MIAMGSGVAGAASAMPGPYARVFGPDSPSSDDAVTNRWGFDRGELSAMEAPHEDPLASPEHARGHGGHGSGDGGGRERAGAAGTAAMTLAYESERRLRPGHRGSLDYDDSLVPGRIVANIMHLSRVTDRRDEELGLLLRWSYGSVFGIWHGLLRRRFGEPWAAA